MQFLKSSLDKYDLRDYLMIIVGTLIYGFGFNGFILSNEIITGGLSGLCALIYFATGQMIPVSVSYFVINILLLAIALKILGYLGVQSPIEQPQHIWEGFDENQHSLPFVIQT